MSTIPPQTAPGTAGVLVDGCGRVIDHLRLSLTDHCNLACRYCVADDAPPSGAWIERAFAFGLVRWLSGRHGICHVRLTGGEPLLYPDLVPLIERLHRLPTLDEVTLTTNAQALPGKARALRDAGLSRINISLDTLKPEAFRRMTRGGDIRHTLRGIEAALEAGLSPVRMNMVVQRGVNDDELADLAAWGIGRGCVVRFLETMPIGPMYHLVEQHLVPAAEIIERLSERFELRPIPRPLGQPATDYAAAGEGVRGVVGIISSTTRPFCEQCRRIRITARGTLLPCIFDRDGSDLKQCWDGGRLDESRADDILRSAVAAKAATGDRRQPTQMIQIGG